MINLAQLFRSPYGRLLLFVKPHWRIFAVSVLAMFFLASTEWMLPALLKPLIDENLDSQYFNVKAVPLLLITLFFFRGVFSYIATVSLHLVAQKAIEDMRNAMFCRLLRLNTEFLDNNSLGALVSKFTFDVNQVAEASTKVITVFVKDSLVVFVLLLYLFYLNWQLAILLIMIAPPISFFIARLSQKMRNMSKKLQASMGNINEVTEESIRANKEIKVFNAYQKEEDRFFAATSKTRKFHIKVVRASAALVPAIQLFVAISIALLIYIAIEQTSQGLTTKGEFIAFITATALLLPPIKRLAGANEFLQRGIAASQSVCSLIDNTPEFDSEVECPKNFKELAFERVSFSYDKKSVLNNITFRIRCGELFAIVGPSGGGKTTFLKLLPRFYKPSSGQILLDGVRLDSYSLRGIREHIAYVGQETILFNASIFENLIYGCKIVPAKEQIQAALKFADLSDYIRSLPTGLETKIGQNGVKLSGGQRQRLAIARAFLKEAKILIFDEPTASLDADSESEIKKSIAKLTPGRISFVVTHRLSTVLAADKILFISDGKIQESGSHKELLAKKGQYFKMYSENGLKGT